MTSELDQAAVMLLNRLEDAVFIVEPNCRMMHANAAGHAVLGARQGLSVRAGRLTFDAGVANERLSDVIQKLAAVPVSRADHGRIVRVRSRRDWLLCITVLQKDRERRALSFAVHWVSRLYTRKRPARLFMSSFALSRRETQVLSLLTSGHSVREAAASLSLSHETIRTNLKHLFRKLNVQSQRELLALTHKLTLFYYNEGRSGPGRTAATGERHRGDVGD